MSDPRYMKKYYSYIVGFVLSVITTFLAYYFVVNEVWPNEVLVYVVLAIAVVQLVVQVVFFLHIGRGSKWKLITFLFTVLIIKLTDDDTERKIPAAEVEAEDKKLRAGEFTSGLKEKAA